MTPKPMCYVAGPLTHPEPMENTHNAIRISTVLLDSGVVVPFVPHLTCFWHLITPRDYETWLAYDLEVLHRCDVMLRIPGDSEGATREERYAAGQKIPIFYDVDDVIAWANAR